ncbi:GPP34 family phosphoprotein [Streptomyces sp. CRN 30]|uniref:GPP34 family phosphoprotein n=1 Tax=Streptomyces sp. CRN 30 TaxID=3075613 RepID=UPI002A80DE27|nr:GPP34 family phosphoprotein [Streptomyces sp. CRN 30]
MTTARDLTFVSSDVASEYPVERGDLALALAGAELIDLLAAGTVVLDDGLVRPAEGAGSGDPLLAAAAGTVRGEPRESVADWLWRRGEGLADTYRAATGTEDRGRPRRAVWRTAERTAPAAPADPRDRGGAADRWHAGEPVLVALAAAVGIRHDEADRIADPDDEAVTTVLAAVGDAVVELAAIRQRRSVEEAAFDNIWRGW